jgi:hypothetical protein
LDFLPQPSDQYHILKIANLQNKRKKNLPSRMAGADIMLLHYSFLTWDVTDLNILHG